MDCVCSLIEVFIFYIYFIYIFLNIAYGTMKQILDLLYVYANMQILLSAINIFYIKNVC